LNIKQNIIEQIKSAKKVLIVGHIRPDGDCFGSGFAIALLCKKLNIQADFVCDSGLPQNYSFMDGFDCVNSIPTEPLSALDHDTVIAIDCGTTSRMGKFASVLKQAQTSINIDHHPSNDNFAKINLVDPAAAATCQIIAEILLQANLMDAQIAQNLLIGLSTDTGHFRHSNTNKSVLSTASTLIDCGADLQKAVISLYKSRTIAQTKLIGRAVDSLKFFHNNLLAFMTVLSSDLTELGCEIFDTEGLIDYALNLDAVEIAVCICQHGENGFKVGLRSKNADVATLSTKFGGGGHRQAAGCMIFGTKEEVTEKIISAAVEFLG